MRVLLYHTAILTAAIPLNQCKVNLAKRKKTPQAHSASGAVYMYSGLPYAKPAESTSDVIGIRLAKQNDEVDQRSDTEQTRGAKPKDTCADFSLVEAVNSQIAEEEAQQNGDPLVLLSAHGNSDNIVVIVVIIIVDDDRLTCRLRALQLLNLTSAVGAHNRVLRNDLSAVLAELCRTVHRLLNRLVRLILLRNRLLLRGLYGCVSLLLDRLRLRN